MAKFVWTDAFFSVGGNDLSNRVRRVTLDNRLDEVDITAMGVASYREKAAGMKNWTVDADLYEDFASGQIDSLLFPLIGTVVAVLVRPVAASAVSATNPNYTGNASVVNYKPIEADVGTAALAVLRLHGAGALTRAVA